MNYYPNIKIKCIKVLYYLAKTGKLLYYKNKDNPFVTVDKYCVQNIEDIIKKNSKMDCYNYWIEINVDPTIRSIDPTDMENPIYDSLKTQGFAINPVEV